MSQPTMKSTLLGSLFCAGLSAVVAFQTVTPRTTLSAPTTTTTSSRSNSLTSSTQLQVAVDPTVVTKKEYEDICGVAFDANSLERRLQATNFLYPKHVEVIEDIAPIAGAMVDDVLLETGEKAWQPQDFLPDLTQDGWEDSVKEMRQMAATIPDDLLVVLIGDMVTEEALPTYQTLLNTFEGCDDPTGTTDSAWARWSRGWTSEENRHGDLLNKYLYLGGRCNMRSIEVTIQHLLTNGFNPQAKKDPYRGFVYTSFQERATKISHGNVGRLARQHGEKNLARICAQIAGDEGRHEKAYQTFSEEILKRDPEGFLEVFGDMMRGMIVMPAEEMTDGKNPNLYTDFSEVAQRIGVYTALDYANIIEHLVKRWELESLEGLSGAAEKERDYLCRLPDRYRKLAERSANKKKKATEDGPPPAKVAFDWIYGRTA